MAVPFIDLNAVHEDIRDILMNAIEEVVTSNHFIMGPQVVEFEKEFAAFLNVDHAFGVSSGSDALVMALLALDVGHGDEVITTPFTFFATVEAILRVGAVPRFADIESESFNLDPEAVEDAISPRTKAILVVHLFGRSADMTQLSSIAKRRGLSLIEDAAQSVGAEWNGKRCGGHGDVGCFSFFPAKNLGAFGDGGAVTTQDSSLAEKLKILRIHGSAKRYQHTVLGGNYRLDAIQAAVLRLKLPYLEDWTTARQDAAYRYRTLFQAKSLMHAITLPDPGPGRHVFNQFVLRVLDGKRDALFDELGRRDIGRAVYYPLPCHQQPLIRNMGLGDVSMPEAERAAGECLAIPVAPGVTAEQQEEVVGAIAEVLCS